MGPVNVQETVKLKTGETVADPAKVGYAERTPFMRSLCGEYDTGKSTPLEDCVYENTRYSRAKVDVKLHDLAQTYRKYRDQGARLPTFGRWISSMFQKDNELNRALAGMGQKQDSPKIIISVAAEDLLRSGDVIGGDSCLKWAGDSKNYNYHYVLQEIVRACPGIGVAYIPDPSGFMKGRAFINHAVDEKTGKDMVCINPVRGTMRHDLLKRIFSEKGLLCATMQTEWYDPTKQSGEFKHPIKMIGNFKEKIHYDVASWPPDKTQYVQLL